MWSSKDVSFIIFLAVLGLVSTALIVQMAGVISGVPGANYVFTIILATQTSFSFLIYEGRRWRFFAQFSLFTLLIIPTYLGGPPFFAQGKMHFIITAFLADLIINSFYKKFEKTKKLHWWSILGAVLFWLMLPFFGLLIMPLFFAAEYVALFLRVVVLLLPVIIAQAIAGGYLGYRIYRRVRRELQTDHANHKTY